CEVVDGWGASHFGDTTADRDDKAERRVIGANDNGHPAQPGEPFLRLWLVECLDLVIRKSQMLDVAGDADDCASRVVRLAEADTFAQRVFIRPEAARHWLIGD